MGLKPELHRPSHTQALIEADRFERSMKRRGRVAKAVMWLLLGFAGGGWFF